jgi:acyl carrier protein
MIICHSRSAACPPSCPFLGADRTVGERCSGRLFVIYRLFKRRRGDMASTFDQVADVLADHCSIPRAQMTPESHILDDLQIDSLDFLDSAYALDKRFGVKLPIERFADDDLWTLGKLSAAIDALLAEKGERH